MCGEALGCQHICIQSTPLEHPDFVRGPSRAHRPCWRGFFLFRMFNRRGCFCCIVHLPGPSSAKPFCEATTLASGSVSKKFCRPRWPMMGRRRISVPCPWCLEGFGLRSATRTSTPACWATWSDRIVAVQLVDQLGGTSRDAVLEVRS